MNIFCNLYQKYKSSSVWNPIIKSAGIGSINKFVSIGIRLFTIPLLLNYLGKERFGLWMTIASYSGYISLMDLGISNAVVNELTKLFTEKDYVKANKLISEIFFILLTISSAGMFLILPSVGFLNLSSFFKLTTSLAQNEVNHSAIVILVMFFLQLPLSIFLKIPYTLQKGFLSEMYLLISNIVSFIALFVFIKIQASLPLLLVLLTGTMNFAAIGLALHLVFGYGFSLRWSNVKNTIETFSDIRHVGSPFLLMQITGTLLSILPFSLIAYYHGAVMVANYGIMMQVMMAIQIPFTITHQPLWTKITQLYLLKDINNLKNIVKKYFKYALFYSIISAVLLTFGVDYFFLIFFSKDVQIDLKLKIAFAIWGVFGLIAGGGLGTLLIALQFTKQMARVSFFQLIIYILAGVLLIPLYADLGSVLAIILAYILTLPFLLSFVSREFFDSRLKFYLKKYSVKG